MCFRQALDKVTDLNSHAKYYQGDRKEDYICTEREVSCNNYSEAPPIFLFLPMSERRKQRRGQKKEERDKERKKERRESAKNYMKCRKKVDTKY